jgi:hypothetical protein
MQQAKLQHLVYLFSVLSTVSSDSPEDAAKVQGALDEITNLRLQLEAEGEQITYTPPGGSGPVKGRL